MALLSSPFQYITSTPPATRIFTASTIALSCLYFWLRWHDAGLALSPYLILIPGSSVFHPWTFLTSGLVETNLVELLVSLLLIPASLRYLERLWGTTETLKFIVISIAIPNLLSCGLNWLEFVVTRNADLFLYGMGYRGQMALQTAILVAFTQLIPEHQVQIFGVLKARVKRLPMAYVGFSNVMCLLGWQSPYILIQFGWLVSWTYLRFYKRNSADVVGGDLYGDRSETFAFIHWFPPFVHYPVSLLSNTVHTLAKKFHIIPSSAPDVESGGYAQLPGGARAEAERRRAMALKALDQRLATSSPAQAPRNGHTSQNNTVAISSRPPLGGTSSQTEAGHSVSPEDSVEQESTVTGGGDKNKGKAREEA